MNSVKQMDEYETNNNSNNINTGANESPAQKAILNKLS